MTATADLMVDLSSNNGPPNLKAHYKAGHRVIALKATEGTGYTWDAHRRLADEWHQLGGSVWHYHFARPTGRPALAAQAQARYFLAAITLCWRDGDRIALDVEVGGIGPAFVRAFINFCHDRQPTWPGVVYSFASFLSSAKIKPAHGWGLWLAAYGAAQPAPVAGWDHLTAWQFTDKAVAAGMAAPVDQSRLLDPLPAAKSTPVLSKPQRRNIRRIIAALRRLLRGNP